MNYYPFHIGDFESATIHLSWDEDMAYRRLIDSYYKAEGPLPLDAKAIYRLVRATDKRQRNAVDAVLSEFFFKDADGYHNARCDEEIAKAVEKRGKAKASAERRWGNADDMRTHSERNAKAMRTHSEGNAPNPNPNPNPSLEVDRPITSQPALPREDWAVLENRLREAAGWQNEPAPKLAIVGPIAALLEAGADLDADVLPTIRALAPNVTSRTSWKYFIKPIQQAAADRRQARAPPLAAVNGSKPYTQEQRAHDLAVIEKYTAKPREQRHG